MLLKPPSRLPNGIAHSMAHGLGEGTMCCGFYRPHKRAGQVFES
jgi:hypothetical protein